MNDTALPPAAQEAIDAFTGAAGWEQRARLLMQWGERLEPLADSERNDGNRVRGCESQVWLIASEHDSRWHFRADSEARLLRGLLAVLLARVDGLDAQALRTVDVAEWFNRLGLGRQLSPSRANGINAVLSRMQALAAR
ncbi:SufE family protein [Stutzerimonas urumqiensis]|uniref:SufE family protein n=1 Tax=Stutzerimonas urumqiensis TaxID=638269 RepID=UPI003DA4D461